MKSKNVILMVLFCGLGAVSMNAQLRVGGLGNPTASALLDVNASDATNDGTQGLALPRVELVATDNVLLPIPNPIKGLTVYNTKTVNDVTEGTYYTDGKKWIKIGGAASAFTSLCPDSVQGIDLTYWYKVGDFGAAGCWLTENLRDSTNTGAVYDPKDNTVIKNIAAYEYPNRVKDNVATYGLLYNWLAATKSTYAAVNEGYGATSQSIQTLPINVNGKVIYLDNPVPVPTQGICPAGFHIPSDTEWSELEKEIAQDAEHRYSTSDPFQWNMDWNTAVGGRTYNAKKLFRQNQPDASTAGEGNAYNAPDVTRIS